MEIYLKKLLLHPQQSNEIVKKKGGPVVQLVRIPACHAGGRGFESRPDRFFIRISDNV